MKKLKIKKNVKKIFCIIVVLLILLSIGIHYSIKIYKQKEYEKTTEFKLLQIGYTKSESEILIDKYKQTEIEYILKNDLNEFYLTIFKEKYYIYDNFYEYLEYYQNNPNKSLSNIVEIINTNRDGDYYTNTIATDISKNELMLVNKYTYLDSTYTPENLVTISQTYSWGNLGSQKATQETYDAFLNMWEEAKNEGHYLMVSSSFRTYEKQELVYNDYKDSRGTDYADSIAARPGYSEHQTGLALDIFEKTNSSQKTFHETTTYLWLKENAHKFGFILRYPKEKENITGYSFESWHYRYVGNEIATYIYQNNITFDEYYAYYLK